MTLRAEHLIVHVNRSGIHGEYREVKITHQPTGISVEGHASPDSHFKSELQLKEALLTELTDKVMDFKIAEWHESDSDQTVYEYLGIPWGQYATWMEQREERDSFDTIGTPTHSPFRRAEVLGGEAEGDEGAGS